MIYIDLTGLCDRKWTGVENYANTLYELLSEKFSDIMALKVGVKGNKSDEYILGSNKGRLITEYIYIPNFIKRNKDDIFIFPIFPPSLICWRFSKNIIPVIHDTVAWNYRYTMSKAARIIIVPRMKKAIKTASKIITVSETAKKDLQKINSKPVYYVIYNCIDQKKRRLDENILAKLELVEKNYIVTVSTLEPRKNFNYLLNVIDNILDKKDKLKFVVVGRAGWGEIKYLFRNKNRLVFSGYLTDDQLYTLYSKSLLFITLPIDEGFGRTPIEAALCHIPVAVSDIPVFHEIIGKNALFLPMDEKNKTVEKLLEYLENNDFKYVNSEQLALFSRENVAKSISSELLK